MSTNSLAPVGLALLSVLQILGKLVLWLTIAALAFCAAVLLATDFFTGCQFLMFLSIAFGGIAGMMSAWRRQRALAREAAERPPLPLERPFRPSCVACLHPTRGVGQLVVNEQGDLHFLPEDSGTAKSVAYFGLDLEQVGLLRLVGRRLKTFFCPGFRKKLYRTERSLFIPRACLRYALPLPRFVMGPTVAVAYELPGEKTLRIEDFTLCTIGGNQVNPHCRSEWLGVRPGASRAIAQAAAPGLPSPRSHAPPRRPGRHGRCRGRQWRHPLDHREHI